MADEYLDEEKIEAASRRMMEACTLNPFRLTQCKGGGLIAAEACDVAVRHNGRWYFCCPKCMRFFKARQDTKRLPDHNATEQYGRKDTVRLMPTINGGDSSTIGEGSRERPL